MKAGQHELMRQVEDDHWWYRVLHEQVLRVLRSAVPPGQSLLDAGCGTGGMLCLLNEWQTHGCDIAAEAVEQCRARGLVRVVVSSVHAMPYADESFEAVLSLDVLYHARVDEHLALSELRRVLKRGGLLILNVPAFDCLRGAHDVAVDGVRRYRRDRLNRLLRSHGFEVVEAHYWNAWLFLPLLLRRWFSQCAEGDLALPPKWLNALLTAGGRLDAALCRHTRIPLGSSLMVVARSCRA
ncbi:MAG: class I SAM-dependent methyltransferase [Verrucomicrobiaceae bacterium]|nr:class I SAM-dependent methyltransferase [Verrucomicrobiaceae bacterium]